VVSLVRPKFERAVSVVFVCVRTIDITHQSIKTLESNKDRGVEEAPNIAKTIRPIVIHGDVVAI